MRTSTRRPAVIAAAAVAALSLTLTACGGGGGTKDEGAAKTEKSAAGTTGSSGEGTTGSGTSGSSDSGTTASGTEGSGTKGGTDSGSAGTTGTASNASSTKVKAPACKADDIKISAAKQAGTPTTHISLTAKNVSGRACTLLKYPLIAFGEIQTAKDVPAVDKSNPGTPVVLGPGAPAFAAVRIAEGGAHENNRVVNSFNVNLFAADGPAEGSKVVSAPGGGIAVNDSVAKTGYWTPELRNGADEF
ncbi:DUF4232 domain-containing protein [Streptomyces sp. NPDC050504]|uniref:DUF4232 domain-containing protein n=1 Tax=Streptomyces sp. NPDC050504 TaxID=3365618 RepID=UPI00378EADCC